MEQHPLMARIEAQKKAVRENLSGVKRIIAVGSGKGGVGKTFVALNLAWAFSAQGLRVGVLDCDIDCPNIFVALQIQEPLDTTDTGLFEPVEKFGLKLVSMAGIATDENRPLVWRGPLIGKAVVDFLGKTNWGELDVLILDLPPGCLGVDTTLFGPSRSGSIAEITKGDAVFSVDVQLDKTGKKWMLNSKLNTSKVLKKIDSGTQEVFLIKTKTRSIACSASHPLLIVERVAGQRGAKRLIWKKSRELKISDLAVVVKKLPDYGRPFVLPEVTSNASKPIKQLKETTVDFAKVIGFFLGDGYIRKDDKGRFWSVWFCEPINGKYRREYEKRVKALFGRELYLADAEFAVISNQACELFSKIELEHGALDKRVPKWVFGLPHDQIKSLIEGYCDADGHRRKSKAKFRRGGWMCFESPNRGLIADMRNLVLLVGWSVTNLNNRIRETRLPSGKKTTQRYWGFEANKTSKNDLFGSGLIRGKQIGKGLMNEFIGFARIQSIQSLGDQPTKDIQLEQSHSFVADGFVAHNTSDAALSIMQFVSLDAFVVVSTNAPSAVLDAQKTVAMARQMSVPVVGVVENMRSEMFGKEGVEQMAARTGALFAGALTLSPSVQQALSTGQIASMMDESLKGTFEQMAISLKNAVSDAAQK